MTAGNHEVHTQEGEEYQHIELTLLDKVLLAAQPFVSHEEDNERTHVEHRLEDGHHRGVLIHATKGFGSLSSATGQEVERGVCCKQHYRQASIVNALPALFIRTHKEVGYKQDENHCQQRQLFVHI